MFRNNRLGRVTVFRTLLHSLPLHSHFAQLRIRLRVTGVLLRERRELVGEILRRTEIVQEEETKHLSGVIDESI
jgi:hypothetical protein